MGLSLFNNSMRPTTRAAMYMAYISMGDLLYYSNPDIQISAFNSAVREGIVFG